MDNLAAGQDDKVPGEAAHASAPGRITARDAIAWWIDGLVFWRFAPIRLAVVCLLPLLLEAVIQLLPWIGTPLSKVVVPFFANGVVVVLDRLWTTREFRWRGLWWSFAPQNRRQALQVALIIASVFVLQVACAMAVFGVGAFDAVVWGHLASHPDLMTRSFPLVLILPGVPLGTLLMFTVPLVVLQHERPIEAAKKSIRLMVSSPAALVFFCLITCLLFGLALVFGYGLLLLLVIPWTSLTGYAAYRRVFLR